MIQAIVKVGAFPNLKEIKDFDFDFQSSINQQQIHDYTTLRVYDVGKTHLALGTMYYSIWRFEF